MLFYLWNSSDRLNTVEVNKNGAAQVSPITKKITSTKVHECCERLNDLKSLRHSSFIYLIRFAIIKYTSKSDKKISVIDRQTDRRTD